jgi:hypothetical protein
MFNCEPGGCPDEAACVAFNETSCSNEARSGRILRTFCMLMCGNDGDCRSGYYCREMGAGDPSAQIVDPAPAKTGVCAVAPNGAQVSPVASDAGVCEPGEGTLPLVEASAGDAQSDGNGTDTSLPVEASAGDAQPDVDDTASDTGPPDERSDEQLAYVAAPVD